MTKKEKPPSPKDHKPMTIEEATAYLKSIDEWESVWRLERETILKWAEFLKERKVEK